LKSASANIGATALARTCEELERMAAGAAAIGPAIHALATCTDEGVDEVLAVLHTELAAWMATDPVH